jgi:hypothetical protein
MAPAYVSEQLAIDNQDAPVQVADPSAQVNIAVKCNGMNMKKLSVYDLAFLANVIEDSYNTVHGDIDDDDTELIDTHYQGNNAMLESSDLDLVQSSGYYRSSLICRYCKRRQAAEIFALVGDSDATLAQWENELAQGLVKSNKKAFDKVKQCSIKMAPAYVSEQLAIDNQDAPVQVADPSAQVNIAVKCNGMNTKKLSVYDLAFLANEIEDSYNTVHGDIDDDDTELIDTHYQGKNTLAAGIDLVKSSGYYRSSLICRYCKRRQAADILALVGDSEATQAQWENELAQGLVKSNKKAFEKVKQCSIKMAPAASATESKTDGEGLKCGLRACADS